MRTKIALLFAVVLGILAVLGIQAYLSRQESDYEKLATRVSISASVSCFSRMCFRMTYCSATPANVEAMMYMVSPLGAL